MFFTMILYYNDGLISQNEVRGLIVCLAMVPAVSFLFYWVYRQALRKVCILLCIPIECHNKRRK